MLEAGGILTGGASAVLGAIALTNFWNPAGWTAAAVLGGLTIASALAGFLGRRSRRSGEKERVQERARAIGEARRVVAAQFDTWEETQLQRVVTDAWAQSADTLKGLVQQSVTNRESNSELTLISAKLEKKARDIPHAPPSADVIGRGVELVVGSSSSRSETEILLGEDWLDFEVPPADRVFLSKRDKTAFRQKSDGDRDRLEDFLHAATGGLRLNDIQRFLTQASSSGCLDEDNAAVLHELSNNFGRPRIALIGDYSAGKTSLIKRLLADSGDEVPNTLVVHAGPATSSATGYRYGSFDLVDLPGFQGHNGAHDETAVLEARDAGLIMILLNTNLLLGDTSALREVLLGSARVAAKAGRCIFVIGRIDDIGVDPESAPRDFISRCRRKEAELLSALRASGFPIHSNQIFSLAADPFGMVGNRAPVSAGSYLERHRLWDGVRTIADPLLAQHPTQALKMSAAGALDSALSILTVTREAQRHAVEELEGERADALAMEGALEDALSELRLLQRALTQRCQLVVEEHANEMIAEALGAGPSEASAIAETLAKWWRDPRLDTAVEQFMTAAERDIREWQENNDSVIDRKLLRIAARVNLSSTSGEVPPTSSGGDRLASTVLQQASRIVSGFGSRDAVYRVGKSFRYKFKPWGAVKGGVRVARIGVALGFVAVTFDTIAFIRDLKAEDGRESARHRAAEQVRDTAPQVIDQILRGTEDGPSGPLTYLDAQEQTLREALEALARRRATVSEAIATVQTQTGTLDKIFTDARKLDTRRPEEQR